MIRILDLFSGIGAFSLGLERTGGFQTVAFCEIDPFCRRVLAKNFPGVPIYDDVRTLTAERLRADGLVVDAIVGGFPCQGHSVAGQRRGSNDTRDMWPEFHRLIREVRPRWVIAENVRGLLSTQSGRFFAGILRDFSRLGYDAEWRIISAADMGAPHIRERVWIVAYPDSQQGGRIKPQRRQDQRNANAGRDGPQGAIDALSYPDSIGLEGRQPTTRPSSDVRRQPTGPGEAGDVANAACCHDWWRNTGTLQRQESESGNGSSEGYVPQPGQPRLQIGEGTIRQRAYAATTGDGWWATESGVGRVVNGPDERVDRRARLIALGNALVPDIPEILGNAVLHAERGCPVDDST